MLKIFWLVFGVIVFYGCNKKESTTSRLVTVNASHSLNSITAKWNSFSITSKALAPSENSGTSDNLYKFVPAGTSNLIIQNSNDVLLNKNIYAAPSIAYTLLIYDTATKPNSSRVLYLTDNIPTSDLDTSFIRFLHFVPAAKNVDVILLRTAVNDTIFRNVPFIDKDMDEKVVEAFEPKKKGAVTGIKIVETGTSNKLAELPGFSFQKQGYYTIIYSGLASASALKVLKH